MTFQERVGQWIHACFGPVIAKDRKERNHRFLEESLELVQACGCSKQDVLMLVDYVYNRPLGSRHQEIGGVMTTLASLCLANDEDMGQCGEEELQRNWFNIEKIRAKQAGKPKDSALPQ